MEVAANLRLLHERRRLAAERRLRSSGGRKGRPSRSYTCSSVPASGSGSSASTYPFDPVARTSSVPNCSGRAATSSTGMPSTVTPTACRSWRSRTATTSGWDTNRSSASGAVETSTSRWASSHPRRSSPASHGVERRRDRGRERECPAAGQSAPCRLRLPGQRREHFRLGRRADSRRLPQAAGLRRRAQLVRGADPERTRRAPRAAAGPSRGSGPARRARARPRARAPRARRSVPSRRARAGAARCRGRFRAAPAPGRVRTSCSTGAAVVRIRSAARRYARTLQCAAPARSSNAA